MESPVSFGRLQNCTFSAPFLHRLQFCVRCSFQFTPHDKRARRNFAHHLFNVFMAQKRGRNCAKNELRQTAGTVRVSHENFTVSLPLPVRFLNCSTVKFLAKETRRSSLTWQCPALSLRPRLAGADVATHHSLHRRPSSFAALRPPQETPPPRVPRGASGRSGLRARRPHVGGSADLRAGAIWHGPDPCLAGVWRSRDGWRRSMACCSCIIQMNWIVQDDGLPAHLQTPRLDSLFVA